MFNKDFLAVELLVVVVIPMFVGCHESLDKGGGTPFATSANITSLDEAEVFAKTRGVEIVKDHDYETTDGNPAREYKKYGNTELHSVQFQSQHDMNSWIESVKLIFPKSFKYATIGNVVFVIDEGPDDEIAAILEKLK